MTYRRRVCENEIYERNETHFVVEGGGERALFLG
jgi:hypothetical protein